MSVDHVATALAALRDEERVLTELSEQTKTRLNAVTTAIATLGRLIEAPLPSRSSEPRPGRRLRTGLDETAQNILSVIRSTPGLTTAQLADRMHVSKTAVLQRLRVLVDVGFVLRDGTYLKPVWQPTGRQETSTDERSTAVSDTQTVADKPKAKKPGPTPEVETVRCAGVGSAPLHVPCFKRIPAGSGARCRQCGEAHFKQITRSA